MGGWIRTDLITEVMMSLYEIRRFQGGRRTFAVIVIIGSRKELEGNDAVCYSQEEKQRRK